MMYSGKSLPLRAFVNGGTPCSKDAATPSGMAGLTASENCDPNYPKLSVFGKEALRKARELSNSVLDESNGNILQLPQPDGAGKLVAAAVVLECDSIGTTGEPERSPQQSKEEVTRLPCARPTFIPSPTKTSPSISHQHSHDHGHGGRAPHFCRSPRCASNNPDYAVPAQPPPRKYLISKRHLLPGAICTKDPAILASQIRPESSFTPSQATPSTGKPPKPSRKLESAIRELSFTDVAASERTTPPPLAYKTSPTRIPKPPSSARSPASIEPPAAGLHESMVSRHPQDSLSSGFSGTFSAPTTEPRYSEFFSPNADAQQQPVLVTYLEDDYKTQGRIADADARGLMRSSRIGSETSQDRIADADVGGSTQSSHVGSETCAVAASTSPPIVLDADGSSSEAVASVSPSQLDSPITSARAGHVPVTELLSEERQSSPTSMESPGELPSDQRTPEPAGSVSVSALATVVPSSSELEDVTEKLAEKLAFEDVEEATPLQVRDCHFIEDTSCANALKGLTKSEDGSMIYPERDDTEEQQFSSSERGRQLVEGNQAGVETGGDYQSETAGGESYEFRNDMTSFDDFPSSEGMQDGQEEVTRGRSIDSFIEEFESAQKSKLAEGQREVPKYVRGKGRQLWKSDCRDSREVVFLKQTPQAERGEDWMVDSMLEGAISKLNPSGRGRVRVLVEAFESLLNLGGNPEMVERRASRVWCLNRMEKGEVDEDGEAFEEGDQRVDCYEVSGDGLQLRASMRLSLGGSNRLPLYNPADIDEIEMSAIQKVQEWDDDCRQSQPFEDLDNSSTHSYPGTEDLENQNEGHCEASGLALGDSQRRLSFNECPTLQNDNDRSSEDFSCDAQVESQFGCYTGENVNVRTDARSTFSLDEGYKHKAPRRRRYWKANPVNLEPAGLSSNCGTGKAQRTIRGTSFEPFRLVTEERGMMKEYQFAQKLEQMFAEEERLRNPLAQGLPWTTDEPEVVPKPPVKGQTRPVEFRHFSDSRAIERAEFDNYMADRAWYTKMQKQEAERLRQFAEQEEIKRLRREMVPRAQLMPFFDQPFIPSRSSKRLTVPKEPTFLSRQHKRARCIVWQQQQRKQQQEQPWTFE